MKSASPDASPTPSPSAGPSPGPGTRPRPPPERPDPARGRPQRPLRYLGRDGGHPGPHLALVHRAARLRLLDRAPQPRRRARRPGPLPADSTWAECRPRSRPASSTTRAGSSPATSSSTTTPTKGGSHLPDIFMFKPVFAGETLVAYACAMSHHTDVGGRVAGGNSSDCTEIYQEGLRIPPLKLYERGEPNRTLFRIIEKAVRVPDKVLGDRPWPGLRPPARRGGAAAARRAPRRRAVPRAPGRGPRLHREPHPDAHPGAPRRCVPLHRPRRRRRFRLRAHRHRRQPRQGGRRDPGRLHRHVTAGEGRDQQSPRFDPIDGVRGHPGPSSAGRSPTRAAISGPSR